MLAVLRDPAPFNNKRIGYPSTFNTPVSAYMAGFERVVGKPVRLHVRQPDANVPQLLTEMVEWFKGCASNPCLQAKFCFSAWCMVLETTPFLPPSCLGLSAAMSSTAAMLMLKHTYRRCTACRYPYYGGEEVVDAQSLVEQRFTDWEAWLVKENWKARFA